MPSSPTPSLSMTPAFSGLGQARQTVRTAAEGGRTAGPPRQRSAGLRRACLTLSLGLALVLAYFAGGFIRFTQEVAELSTPRRVAPADGIVVLTGGALRVDQAIDLLKEGRAKRLLISGVN